jgi:hypothetical protein
LRIPFDPARPERSASEVKGWAALGAPIFNMNRKLSFAAHLLVLICVLASMTGCAVVKSTNQPDKKNLSVFSAGTPRRPIS